jgi:membrane protein YqaA with SNARE-associated domain
MYLLTFFLALPSGIFWFFNAEVMVVTQMSANRDALPWLVALMTVLGQFIGYVVLYLFAARILARVEFVKRAVAKVRIREAGWGTWTVFMTGGISGMPPLLALFTLYGSKNLGPLRALLACSMPMRFVWYCGWAYAADWMRHNLGFMSCA